MKYLLPAGALLWPLPLNVSAHPGHGLEGHGAAHFISSPYHWAVFLGVGLALFGLARKAGRFAPLLRAAAAASLVLGVAWSLKF